MSTLPIPYVYNPDKSPLIPRSEIPLTRDLGSGWRNELLVNWHYLEGLRCGRRNPATPGS